MKNNEFQIIPKYFLERNFNISLVEQLRIYKYKKIYCVVENYDKVKVFVDELEKLCTHFEIAIHYEKIDDSFNLNPVNYHHLVENIKIGQPEAIVVFGSEKAINYAKLINYVAKNYNELPDFDSFINKLDLPTENSLRLYCVLTNFTLGSENNFVGVLNTAKNNEWKRVAFNANQISTFIYVHEDFYSALDEKEIDYHIFSMFVRCLEQMLGSNTFEFSKNYCVANLQTLINFLDSENQNKYSEEIVNLIWTNLSINNGIANLLSEGDWKLHILAFELVDYLHLNIYQALTLISVSYLLKRIDIDQIYKQMLEQISYFLFGEKDLHILINYLTKLKNKINFHYEEKLSDELIKKIADSALSKIAISSNMSDEQKQEIQDLFISVLNNSFNAQ